MFASKDLFFSKPSGYQISRSVRFRSSASAYFNRTPASSGNRKTWTWSGWVKKGALSSSQTLFSGYVDANNKTRINFSSADVLQVYDITGGATERVKVYSTQVFRDPSAWYHILVAMDTTQATASDRTKVYVNGNQITAFGTATYPTQNTDLFINATNAHRIGADGDPLYFDGYLTEINFIDGQALTPSSFGQTNTITGVWQPLKYTGTYGTNGFYLNFSDNSAATAAAIGKDYSGNGNNWTPNNISVTAGATYDSMLDVPTLFADGGNGRGNYAVWNPISATNQTRGTIADGNLTATTNTTAVVVFSTFAIPSTLKIYVEFIAGTGVSTSGAGLVDIGLRGFTNNDMYTQQDVATYLSSAQKTVNSVTTSYGATYTDGDVIGMAIDISTSTITFYKNNTSQGAVTWTNTFDPLLMGFSARGATAGARIGYINFGQRPFSYTPPTGFVALNTQNLPTPTISNGANYMAATTYTGTGSALTIANTVNGISFQPDFVWVKGRSGATDHALYDSVRGTTKDLVSNSAAAETTQATGLTAFGSTGFTVGALAKMNTNAATYVGWQWKEGATQGFDVVTYASNGNNNVTVNHSLGVAPSMIIAKYLSGANAGSAQWYVYHKNLAAGNVVFLNLTNASTSAPTLFSSIGSTSFLSNMNAGTDNYVAYCFSEVAGYSKFGSYTGNSSADGPFVYLGFRPRFVMIKRTDSIGNWQIIDTSRSPYNEAVATLYPNLTNAEDLTNTKLDALSNGFKIRGTPSTDFNSSGSPYIYAAFAENPFKNSLAR